MIEHLQVSPPWAMSPDMRACLNRVKTKVAMFGALASGMSWVDASIKYETHIVRGEE